LLAAGIDLTAVKVADVMQQPLVTFRRSQIKNASYIWHQFQQHQVRFLTVVNERGELEGIITEHSLIAGLQVFQPEINEQAGVTKPKENSLIYYRDIVENLGELICRFLAKDKTLIYFNHICCSYLDMQPEELIGKSFIALVLQEDRDRQTRGLTLHLPVVSSKKSGI
jgi:PAS domain-containing protein